MSVGVIDVFGMIHLFATGRTGQRPRQVERGRCPVRTAGRHPPTRDRLYRTLGTRQGYCDAVLARGWYNVGLIAVGYGRQFPRDRSA